MAHVQCTCMSSQHHRTIHRNYILNILTLQRDKGAAVLWHIESTQPRYFVHNIHASTRSLVRNANLTEVLTNKCRKTLNSSHMSRELADSVTTALQAAG